MRWTKPNSLLILCCFLTITKDYMYTAGDGFVNPLGWSIAHIACKYGDVMVLEHTHPGSRLEKKLQDKRHRISWNITLKKISVLFYKVFELFKCHGHHSNSRSCFTLSWGLHARDVYCWRTESAQFHGRSSSTLCREQLSNDEIGICANHVAATKWSISFYLEDIRDFGLPDVHVWHRFSLQWGFFIHLISVL